MAIEPKLYTIAEFERFLKEPKNEDRLFELVNGEIIEKMPTQEHGMIALNIGAEIRAYLKTNPIGRVGVEVRHRNPDDEHNDRLPDISFIADTTSPVVKEGAVQRLPDLAVEIKSPDDTYRKMRDTAAYYLANGVKLVWLIYSEKRLIEVYHADGEIEILNEDDVLDGGDVLPGFRLSLNTVFAG